MTRSRLLTTLLAGTAGLFSMAAAACATTQDPRQNVSDDLETPPYRTLTLDERFELRRYEPHIVASTEVTGEHDDATRQGFRRLAGYIFGNNRQEAKVAMTAPVSTQAKRADDDEGVSIAMTAPVATQPTGLANDGKTTWEVTFTMPSKWRMDTLPTPVDDRVKLKERPGRCQAAVIFSGLTTDGAVKEQEALLRTWLTDKGLSPVGEPTLARYNDPFTLPWNRRNEVLIDVDGEGCAATPTAAVGTTQAAK
jgi:hypothetical protein